MGLKALPEVTIKFILNVYFPLILSSHLILGRTLFLVKKFDDHQDQCQNHNQELIRQRGNLKLRF